MNRCYYPADVVPKEELNKGMEYYWPYSMGVQPEGSFVDSLVEAFLTIKTRRWQANKDCRCLPTMMPEVEWKKGADLPVRQLP
jgi:hypothetical protein